MLPTIVTASASDSVSLLNMRVYMCNCPRASSDHDCLVMRGFVYGTADV